MNQRFRLVSVDVFKTCTNAILDLFHKQDDDSPINVIITTKDEIRTQAQNRLYWKWLGQLQSEWGQDKDSLHILFKRRFLARIYLRDGTDDILKSGIENLGVIKQLAPDIYESQAIVVANGISTTKASTKQFTEYLNDIYAFCYGKGVLLEVPSDLKWVME